MFNWKWKLLGWVIGNSFFLFFSFFYLDNKDFFKLKNINVTFHQASNIEKFYPEILQNFEQKIYLLTNGKIWDLNYLSLKEDLEKEFWIEQFYFQKKWPNSLEIQVWVSPILFFYKKNNQFVPYFRNKKWGTPLMVLSDQKNMIIVDFDSEDVPKNVWEELFNFFDQYKVSFEALLPIKKINYNKKGFVFILKDSDITVLPGQKLQLFKMERVTHVLNYLKAHKLEARVIELDFEKKVLVRLHKEF